MKPKEEATPNEQEASYWNLLEKISKRYKGFDLEAVRVVFGVVFTYNAMAAQIAKPLHQAGLTPAGLNTLILLVHGNADGLPLTELSRLLVSSRANVTGVIDSLVQKGFVERTDHPGDRRSIIAKVTPKGREWLEGYFPGHAKIMSSFAAPLSAKERRVLMQILAKIRSRIVAKPSTNRR